MITAELIYVCFHCMESTATKDRLCCAMALMNSTSVLKTREQIYLNEMLNDWSKKCWLTQCKQIINQYWLIFVI